MDDEIKHIIGTELFPFVTPCTVNNELDIVKRDISDVSDNKFPALALTGKAATRRGKPIDEPDSVTENTMEGQGALEKSLFWRDKWRIWVK